MDLRKKITEEIYPGWHNWIWSSPEIEEMAAKRVEICLDCPSLGNGLGFDRCKECGCPIKMKVRSPKSECPLKKW